MRSILLCLLLALPATLAAQQAKLYVLGPWDGGTNNIAAASTNTVTGSDINCSEFDHIGIEVTVRPVTTSTGTVIFKFAESVSGSAYETTPSHTLTVTLSGTNAITSVVDYSIPTAGTFALVQTVSTNAMAMTNVVVYARFKSPKMHPSF